MPLLFDDQTFSVSQALLGGWKITHKPTGVTCKPNTSQKERIGFLWKKMQEVPMQRLALNPAVAEAVMFAVFAQAVFDPMSQVNVEFLGTDIDLMAVELVREANRIVVAERLGST